MIEAIVIPETGEAIDPDDPEALIRAYRELRDRQKDLRDTMGVIRDNLAEIASRNGSRTLKCEAGVVEVSVKNEYKWHLERLEKLKGMGLPDERFYEMVKFEPRVKARVAFQIAKSNPEYAATIEDAFEVSERREVRVS
jgi:hypothetical protein